jgi:hypothetical protein
MFVTITMCCLRAVRCAALISLPWRGRHIVLLIIRYQKVRRRRVCHWRNVRIKFSEDLSTGSEFEMGHIDTETPWYLQGQFCTC